MCELSPTSTERKRYVVLSLGILQSCTGIQLSVYHQLDIPHGHRDMSIEESHLLLIQDRCLLNKDIQMQHKVFFSHELKKVFHEILKHLLKKEKVATKVKKIVKKRKMLNKHERSRQWLFQDCGYNSGVSHSRGNNRKYKKHIPLGISIPDCNVREGEEVLIDNTFRLLSKYLLFICPWIWEDMPEERIE